MRKFVAALLLATPLALLAGPSGWFQGTLEEAKAAAKERGTVVVLKFYADW